MKWKLLLILLFTVVPAIELYLILLVGRQIGAFSTAFSLVCMGILGATLAKREGLAVFRRLRQDMARGIPPAESLIEGVQVLAGAILLITPGYFTDLFGLLMLIPFTRRRIARLIKRQLGARYGHQEGSAPEQPEPDPAPEPRPKTLPSKSPFKHPVA